MKYFVVLLSLLFSHSALAEDVTIDMLNKGEDRSMVFSKEIVRIDLGDTVFWKSIDKGHNVEFIKKNGVPDGAGIVADSKPIKEYEETVNKAKALINALR